MVVFTDRHRHRHRQTPILFTVHTDRHRHRHQQTPTPRLHTYYLRYTPPTDTDGHRHRRLNLTSILILLKLNTIIFLLNWLFHGKIGRIYTQLKSGFLFATPSILASCGSHRRGKHGNLHTFAFFSLTYTRFRFCLFVYHTVVDLSMSLSHIGTSYISLSHGRENINENVHTFCFW